jgi:hypothetical protein
MVVQLSLRHDAMNLEATLSVETIVHAADDGPKDILSELLHYELFGAAERVRWQLEDIPWQTIVRDKVGPNVPAFVRQLALAELTTYAATRRFLQEFSDDIDFTQWMSVWFYEETKHPHVLVRWLRELGENFSSREMVRGRITAPFMKSRFGMLVTNMISEVHASALYVVLGRTTEEPVLKAIASNIARDEARHATGFLAYARRALERSKQPEEDRLEALKVLHMWLSENSHVQHPVNTVRLRTAGEDELVGGLSSADANVSEDHSMVQGQMARERALGLVGNLTGLQMNGAEDVVDQIRALTRGATKSVAGPNRSVVRTPIQSEKES